MDSAEVMGSEKMSENHMREIAAIFGLELGEKFRLSGGSEKYYFTKDGLFYEDFRGKAGNCADSEAWEGIMRGDFVIRKIWQPKDGKVFYMPFIVTGEAKYCTGIWYGYLSECRRLLDAGMVCRNREEAEAKAERMLRSILLY